MQYIAIMPHEMAPHKQMSLWTMFVNWEPRVFFRIVPGSSYDEVIRTFICHSDHWSDKLILLDNREYEMQEINALLQAPLSMQSRSTGLQLMAFPDEKTMIIRRDVLDELEKAGVRDNWFEYRFNMLELARRAGCKTAIYKRPEEDEDGIQEQAQGGDGDSGSEWSEFEGDSTGVFV